MKASQLDALTPWYRRCGTCGALLLDGADGSPVCSEVAEHDVRATICDEAQEPPDLDEQAAAELKDLLSRRWPGKSHTERELVAGWRTEGLVVIDTDSGDDDLLIGSEVGDVEDDVNAHLGAGHPWQFALVTAGGLDMTQWRDGPPAADLETASTCGRECADAAAEAAGLLPFDADGRCLLPEEPQEGDRARLVDDLGRAPQLAERDAFIEAYRERAAVNARAAYAPREFRAHREQLGLSQSAMGAAIATEARALGIPRGEPDISRVSQWERGAQRVPADVLLVARQLAHGSVEPCGCGR